MGITAAVAISMASSYVGSENAKTMAAYNERINNANAKLIDLSADQKIKSGLKEAYQYKNKVNAVIGKQRVTAAAAGIAVDTGTIADIQKETAMFGAEDVRTIKNNAYLEAFGMKSQAINLRFEGQAQSSAIAGQQTASLITAGMQGYAMGKSYQAKTS